MSADLSPDPLESARKIIAYVNELHLRGARTLRPDAQAMIAWVIAQPHVATGSTVPDYDHLLPVAIFIFERMTEARDRGVLMTRCHVAEILRAGWWEANACEWQGLGDVGPAPLERRRALSREGVIAYPHPAGAAELRRPEPVFDESTVETFVGVPATWIEGEQ